MKVIAILAAASAAIATPALAAPTIGDNINFASNVFEVNGSATASASVSDGVEFILNDGFRDAFSADFSNGLLTITNLYTDQIGYIGARIVFTDTTNAFTQAVLLPSTSTSNFSQSNVTLANGRLTISFGQAVNANTQVTSSVAQGGSFAIQLAPGAAVPEPATWAMMLLGFGMIAGAARYRRRSTAVSFT